MTYLASFIFNKLHLQRHEKQTKADSTSSNISIMFWQIYYQNKKALNKTFDNTLSVALSCVTFFFI